ncbi:MAG: thioesterase family protein [Bdellovibrionales bacterium]|nr:thioesterase family protein [Bdellovibrionales bacterium]
MNLVFRLIRIVIESFFRRRLHPLSESVLHLRVLPNDLDLNMHMNNGRFLSIMDLGRLDLLIRTDLAGVLLKHRWQPLVGAVNIRYKQSLMPFQKYRLHTKVIGWDEKWFYIEQRFERRNRTIAVGLVKALFRGNRRNITPEQTLKLIDVNIDAPDMPDQVLKWLSMEVK